MSCCTTKTTKWPVRPVKTVHSMGSYKYKVLHADSDDWLDWANAKADSVFALRISHFVGFIMPLLTYWMKFLAYDVLFFIIPPAFMPRGI